MKWWPFKKDKAIQPAEDRADRIMRVLYPGIHSILCNDEMPIYFCDLRKDGVIFATQVHLIPTDVIRFYYDKDDWNGLRDEVIRRHSRAIEKQSL